MHPFAGDDTAALPLAVLLYTQHRQDEVGVDAAGRLSRLVPIRDSALHVPLLPHHTAAVGTHRCYHSGGAAVPLSGLPLGRTAIPGIPHATQLQLLGLRGGAWARNLHAQEGCTAVPVLPPPQAGALHRRARRPRQAARPGRVEGHRPRGGGAARHLPRGHTGGSLYHPRGRGGRGDAQPACGVRHVLRGRRERDRDGAQVAGRAAQPGHVLRSGCRGGLRERHLLPRLPAVRLPAGAATLPERVDGHGVGEPDEPPGQRHRRHRGGSGWGCSGC
mmetsp:Transcript_28400/g.62903  ORF Transcript_28400/g.62903 Transcript_28400/m.62903 type:complete len:275 (-) Transcript_28400:1183-2007(-)